MLRRNGQQADAPALVVKDLDTGYPGNRHALAGISFTVSPGERVAVIGPNGAGKSTLFKAIVGLLPINRGRITIHGLDSRDSHSYVGYVPQQNEIDWSFPASAFDVVMMGRSRHIGWLRRPGKQDRAIVSDLLDHLSLGEFANRQISELSGGQRRRVFIARAMAQDTRVLLMDEPFTGVDRHSAKEIIDALDILRRNGVTSVLSTHHLQTAALDFDKVLIMNRVALAFGPPAKVMTREIQREAFGETMTLSQEDLLLYANQRRRQ